MTEEEKKAIEYLKTNSKDGASFWCYEAIPNFKIICNLIEKQQKELEQEKEENRKLRNCHLKYEEMTGIDLLLED